MKSILLPLVLCLCSLNAFCWDWSLPPFYTEEQFGSKTKLIRFLGPLGEIQETEKHSLYSFHPLWSYVDKKGELGNSSSMDILWPFCFMRNSWFGSTRFFFLYYTSSSADGGRMDYVLPFWFSQTGIDKQFSWALFPFYGNMNNFLTYDRLRFILFPFYWHADKGTVSGDGFLWPLINYDSGPHLERWRVFPFYAYADYKGKRKNRTILWPFYSSQQYLSPETPGYGYLFWPFYGYSRISSSEAWSTVWPFFSYAHDLKRKDSFRINAPYPVFRWGKNQRFIDDDIFFLWPLYGQKTSPNFKSSFVFWPFLWNLENESSDKITVHTWIFPFYWSKSVYSKNFEKKLEESKDFWPVFSLKADTSRLEFQLLNLAPKGFNAVDRNLSPLWKFYTYESKDDNYRSDLLWGVFNLSRYGNTRVIAVQPFYSYRKTGDVLEQSFFFNLFKLKHSPEGKKIRLFYFLEF